MNIYDRIINILLEARVEMFIQDRLDERSAQARANKQKKTQWQASQGGGDPYVGRLQAKHAKPQTPAAKAHAALNTAGEARRAGLRDTARDELEKARAK